MTEDYFEIGVIVNTQGVKGEVRIFPKTDNPKRFDSLKALYLKEQGKEYPLERVRYYKNLVIAKLLGIDDLNTAELLKGQTIIIPRELAMPLNDDEYYVADLVGLEVITTDGEALGILADVLFTGANDVYVVRKDGVKDLLLPAIKQCIVNTDIAGGRMVVRLLEGLREL